LKHIETNCRQQYNFPSIFISIAMLLIRGLYLFGGFVVVVVVSCKIYVKRNVKLLGYILRILEMSTPE
jgi:hypothetical protein